jgi:NAD(P)-dependent dehydrogenase (short-subunit alcohol dehydrogenase family)
MTQPYASYPSLQGRHVLISGGASGIGASMVREFAAQGSLVTFFDIDRQTGETLVRELSGASAHVPSFMACDVTDITALRSAIEGAAARTGPVTVLVNNAANDTRHRLDETSATLWDATMAVNLRHHFFAAQAVIPGMRAQRGGSIINFGSISWMIKQPGMPAYTAAKAAIWGLTRTLAREVGRDGIRVNMIVPGWVMTERQLALWVDAEGERLMDASQCLPGRLQPADIARMVLFLAADDSRMCTAQEFVVDAGWT